VSVEKLTGLLTSSGFRNVVILQPFYQGSISHLIQKGLNGKYVLDLGVPRKFIHDYGTVEEIKLSIGLDGDSLKSQVEEFINEQ
jgi:deoxyxylulose-5-phosphate synthase